jgi:predicted nucleic acid-binding Zn ribbon protein
MPIYEYRRPDGTTFELQQSFSEEALTVDPDTGVPVERVLHPPAVHFKGKGFYNTDYGTRKRQRETAAAAEGSSGKDSSKKDGSSSSSSSSSSEGSSSSGGGDGGGKSEKATGSKDSGKARDTKAGTADKK